MAGLHSACNVLGVPDGFSDISGILYLSADRNCEMLNRFHSCEKAGMGEQPQCIISSNGIVSPIPELV